MAAMTTTTHLPIGALGGHALCAAAGLRDGFRTAQFYARDMANADKFGVGPSHTVPLVSRAVAVLARSTDRALAAGADISIRLLLPTWRNLPSPFAAGFLQQVAEGVHHSSLVHIPLFNAYFFRAAKRILERCTEGPYLVLEHRVDAARRLLAAQPEIRESKEEQLARIMIALTGQRVIARSGTPTARYRFLEETDANAAVLIVACVALLFADAGRPAEIMSEDDFFDVSAALAGPRLARLAALADAERQQELAAELRLIGDLY